MNFKKLIICPGDSKRIYAFAGLILAFAIVLPNLLSPAWIWRMISIASVSFVFALVIIRSLFLPEELEKSITTKSQISAKVAFWVSYGSLYLLAPFCLFIFFQVARDALSFHSIDSYITTEVLEASEIKSGGVSFPFIGQTLIINNKDYYLGFYFGLIKSDQMYELIYSKNSHFIYGVIQK
jgi:hypothetical protein